MLAIHGLRQRDKMHESWIRRATAIVGSSNFGGKLVAMRFNKLWPEPDKIEINVSEAALAQLRKFRENAALNRAKQKVNGRAETSHRG